MGNVKKIEVGQIWLKGADIIRSIESNNAITYYLLTEVNSVGIESFLTYNDIEIQELEKSWSCIGYFKTLTNDDINWNG